MLFVTFHAVMNGVALFWPAAYNSICAFLGANWYALIASAGLGLLFVLHIVYALWLTVQNRRARGNDRYCEFHKPAQVEWASQNMLVLGIVVLAFLVLHLIQFWAKMQLAEICHTPYEDCQYGVVAPQSGTMFLQIAFQSWWTPVCYIIGFIALWFHMTHGFWSMFQSAGWDNNTWLPRLKCIGNCWTTLVCLLFIAQAIVFTVQAHNQTYVKCDVLQSQYEEFNAELGESTFDQAAVCGEAATDCMGCPEGVTPCGRPCGEPCQNPCQTPCANACEQACGQDCENGCANAPCSQEVETVTVETVTIE